jgi:hypothetical protein
MSEVSRMQELAGLKEPKQEEILSPGLVFTSEGFRNSAAKWLSNPANYSKMAKESKMSKAPFYFEMKDSTGIKFPISKNKMGVERLKKILENICKKMPNVLGPEITEYKND